MGTNTAGLYADDVAGTVELFGIDEAGNTTQLTPHDFSLFTPEANEPNPWSFVSTNYYTGEVIAVDMARLARLVQQLTGEQLIYRRQLPADERRDWVADQNANFDRATAALAQWDTRRIEVETAFATCQALPVDPDTPAECEPFTEAQPPDPLRKAPPPYLDQRLRAKGYYDGSIR